jgi:hypothetical protein
MVSTPEHTSVGRHLTANTCQLPAVPQCCYCVKTLCAITVVPAMYRLLYWHPSSSFYCKTFQIGEIVTLSSVDFRVCAPPGDVMCN